MIEVVTFVHEGLGNSSYLVDAGEGEALLVDPDRRSDRYVAAAEERGLRITGVLETHLHADFVTGALEVRAATGATLYTSADAGVAFEHRDLRRGDRLQSGEVQVEVRATPSHTPEHLAFVVRSQNPSAPPLIFTGGSLIVGGAARTDLIDPTMTDPLTRALYRDARHAFDDLPDGAFVLPTHGGGSFCSVGAVGPRASTLGAERATNAVLTFSADEDAFVAWFPSTFPETPAYYARMRGVNAAGPRLISDIKQPEQLDAASFMANGGGGLVVDLRTPDAYAAGHIPGSLAIPFRDSFGVWLGWLAPPDVDLLLVPGEGPTTEALAEAYLVGYERIVGVLEGGIETWHDAGFPLTSTPMTGPQETADHMATGTLLVDVREPDEVAEGAVPGARAIPLGSLATFAGQLPKDRPVVVTCGAGDRAISAASILERQGFTSVASLSGGLKAWREAQLLIEAP